MLHKVFSIRDAKAEIFNPPFYKRTHGEAERDFRSLTTDPKSNVSMYPEDYDLYFIGEYDDVKGTFQSLETPQHILKAVLANKTVQ